MRLNPLIWIFSLSYIFDSVLFILLTWYGLSSIGFVLFSFLTLLNSSAFKSILCNISLWPLLFISLWSCLILVFWSLFSLVSLLSALLVLPFVCFLVSIPVFCYFGIKSWFSVTLFMFKLISLLKLLLSKSNYCSVSSSWSSWLSVSQIDSLFIILEAFFSFFLSFFIKFFFFFLSKVVSLVILSFSLSKSFSNDSAFIWSMDE